MRVIFIVLPIMILTVCIYALVFVKNFIGFENTVIALLCLIVFQLLMTTTIDNDEDEW